MLPPLGLHLVAGPGTYAGGVNIPDLHRRLHELPDRSQVVSVVGRDAPEAVEFLRAGGRTALVGSAPQLSPDDPPRPLARLWSPHPWLESAISCEQPGVCVDMGCGSGRDAVYLASLGYEVHAVDVLPDAIERARDLEIRYLGQARVSWQAGDALEARLPSADVVCLIRCYAAALLDRAACLLKPTGRIVIVSKPPPHRFAFLDEHLPVGFAIEALEATTDWLHVVLSRNRPS